MKAKSKMTAKPNQAEGGKMTAAVNALKKRMAVEALKRHGDLEKAAKELGMTKEGLYALLKRTGVRVSVKLTRTLEIHDPKK